MNRDFHFGTVTVLARWAGFNKEDAHTIAYSSQFVDALSFNGQLVFARKSASRETYQRPPYSYAFRQTTKKTNFTHWDWQSMAENAYDMTNRDVWVPFHFLCGDDTLVTKANNAVAREMVSLAIDDACAHRAFGLHRVGAALHSFADTWAHHGFIGVADYANSVWLDLEDTHEGDGAETSDPIYADHCAKSLALWKAGEQRWDTAKDDNGRRRHWALTWLGHACLLSYPDYPWQHLKYHQRLFLADGNKQQDIPVKREESNLTFFLKAAREVYKYLTEYIQRRDGVTGAPALSEQQEQQLLDAFRYAELSPKDKRDNEKTLGCWYTRMKDGRFGEPLKGEEPIRYDDGNAWKNWVPDKFACYDEGTGDLNYLAEPPTAPIPQAAKAASDADAEAELADAARGLAMPYWVWPGERLDLFVTSDFFRFCEATKRQRADVARLLMERHIYV